MNNISFRPVRGMESNIMEMGYNEGFVYFATDTKKIFIDYNGQGKIPMGGESSIFYGNRPLTDEEKFGDEVLFDFRPDQIDSYPQSLPSENDLILNIPDGGFYRVLEILEDKIQTRRIAVSGSGGGGGGDASNEGSLMINYITPSNSTTLASDDYYIEYEIIAKDSNGDFVQDTATLTWTINGQQIKETVEVSEEKYRFKFKVDSYLDAALDRNKITLLVSMRTGGVTNSIVSKVWYIKAINLTLSWPWTYDDTQYFQDDIFTLSWIPGGGIDCITHISFYDQTGQSHGNFEIPISAQDTGDFVRYNFNSLPYGVYTCKMQLTTANEINGRFYSTPIISNELTFIKGDNRTLLTVPFYINSATQYDTINIPILVYDPDNETCNVTFSINDTEIATENYDRNQHFWPYTLNTFGLTKLTIASGEATKIIELYVEKFDLGISEAKGYAFSLKANDISTNEELRKWQQNGINLTFSENFFKNGSGLDFEEVSAGNIEKFIKVRQGTTLTINYDLFKSSNVVNAGKDFKICFKATNCYKYDAPILSCYDENSDIGIKMDAQQAVFSSSSIKNFNTQYFENSYIEFETEIWPNRTYTDPNTQLTVDDRFIMFWIDGIPAGVKPYTQSEIFIQNNPQKIVIGSEYCDVYIYVVKAYDTQLTTNNHINNFIMDAPSPQKMKERFERNDILDNQGEISYTKLVQKNPQCHAYLYDVPFMTTEKSDKVNSCGFIELYGENNTLDNPYYKAINTGTIDAAGAKTEGKGSQVYVQGTSSAGYGVAAFNLRTKFQEKLINKNGEIVSGWEVSDTGIPIKLSCTKVNVASCENANNVVNQEWYNRFQPYWDAHRRANRNRTDGKLYRDTMEFNSGVVFVKDRNTKRNLIDASTNKPSRAEYLTSNVFLDTPGYTGTNSYYKQYAIGNMGNDKKNTDIFHLPNSVCVEILNNQNEEHWMTKEIKGEVVLYQDKEGINTTITTNVDTEEGMRQYWTKIENRYTPAYEFRYPEDNITYEQQKAFIDFVNWMAECNPKGATGKPLLELIGVESKTYEAKRFEGFNPPGYEGESFEGKTTLAGFIVSDYAGTYNTDSYKYRMAKMLDECEEHLVMDSVVYHYLFIQRHTMVDNVAKNTFWSSEDLKHWDLTKNYDNDTADGNNNTGYLVFGYGIECLDKDENQNEIFNAPKSVWINFIHGLPTVQEHLHKQLENDGAWKTEDYQNEFKKHQNIIPERCWIYDYFRKYIRPRRLGLDEDTYLNRLEGGKKTHQREQYEQYQEFYLNSKYVAGTDFNDSAAIESRFNTKPNLDGTEEPWDSSLTIPMQFYIDCYASGHIGGKTYKSTNRIKRGETYNVPVGTIVNNPQDSTTYIYGAKMIQGISGLAELYPQYLIMSDAPKLQTLQIGNGNETYVNNTKLHSLTLTKNDMLQYVYLQKIGKSDGLGTLSLRDAYQLKDLQITGSTITGLELAKGAIIETLGLNNKIITLIAEDLELLNTVTEETGIEKVLKIVKIKNCPALDNLTYRLSEKGTVTNYTLTGFNWKISNEQNSNGLVLDSNNKITNIIALDNLLNARPDDSTQISLVGTIEIDKTCNVNEYEIYAKYCKQFPNVTIIYGNNVDKIEPQAIKLSFYTDESLKNIHYEVVGNKEENLSYFLLQETSPLGYGIANVNDRTNGKFDYVFTGYWIDANSDNKQLYYLTSQLPEGIEIKPNAQKFNNFKATTDMSFYPEVTEQLHHYTLIFYNDVNSEEYLHIEEKAVYGEPLENYLPSKIPYKDSDSLQELKAAYNFKGYTTSKTITNVVNPNSFTINGNNNFYGVFELIDDISTVVHPEWFDATKVVIDGISGYSISPKFTLQGKITIPSYIDGTPVLQLSGFGPPGESKNNTTPSDHLITHIFMPNEKIYGKSQLHTLAYGCCQNCLKLKYFEFPESLRKISGYAFQSCPLNTDNILNEGLEYIGEYAFNQAFSDEVTNLYIPSTIYRIDQYGFCYLHPTNKNNFIITIGNEKNKSQLDFSRGIDSSQGVGYQVFLQNLGSENTLTVDFYSNIYFNENNSIGQNSGIKVWQCFTNIEDPEKDYITFSFMS